MTRIATSVPNPARLVVALLALALAGLSLWHLRTQGEGLDVRAEVVDGTPVTVFTRPGAGPAPAIVIAHGFAGSQQLMHPFATTLAKSGFVAITFDFVGHGRNPAPLPRALLDRRQRVDPLSADLDRVVAFARTLPGVDGRIGLVGHSMASDVVVRYAMAHPEIAATVGVSVFSPGVTATSPRNLLVVVGALEAGMLQEQARSIVAMASGGPPEPGVTYGRMEDGTARRLVIAPRVEHVAVLYSRDTLGETRDWFGAVFGRPVAPFFDERGPWLGLLLVALIALAWPLSSLLPRVSTPRGAGLPWRRMWVVLLVPALVVPPVLTLLPGGLLPILIGDYLAFHFGLYGLVLAVGVWLAGGFRRRPEAGPVAWPALVVAALAAALYGTLAFAVPLDAYAASFWPIAERLPVIAALFAGTFLYFVADDWATHGPGGGRGAYAVSKVLFLVSLVVAVLLSLQKLFFLIIIIPAILAFFVIFGLFGRWVRDATGHPLVAAFANATIFAWAIGVTFPIVG